MLYPSSVSMTSLTAQITEVVHVLSSECFAERYALTLKLMLSNTRRKSGTLSAVPGSPHTTNGVDDSLPTQPSSIPPPVSDFEGGLESLLSLPPIEGRIENGDQNVWPLFGDNVDGFAWPTELSPSSLPTWLQDTVSAPHFMSC